MQAGINKQYLELAGQPILVHTLRLLENHPLVTEIWVITPEAEVAYCRNEVVARYRFDKVSGVVGGGAERQDSVRNGLLACRADGDDLVLIHDGVRPLLPSALLDRVGQAALLHGAAVIGIPVKDTIKRVAADGSILSTPRREELWQAQTPQAFRYAVIMAAHEKAYREGYRGTDDASLVEWAGGRVVMVEGDYRNLKITTPEDLVVAEALLEQAKEQT